MIRLIAFFIACALAAIGLSWLADRPGSIVINWEGYQIDITVFRAIVALSVLLLLSLVSWSIFRSIWQSPAAVGQFLKKRRQSRGLDALSSGMIAIGSGDREGATRYAIQARKALPNEPLTHLLRAQAAQLTDDRATSRRIYEGMLSSTDTEALGLRGLFLEAEKENETEASKQFAERALRLNPQLGWASTALFEMQCKARDWESALKILAGARKNGIVAKTVADRKRAVLLTAQAQLAEDDDPDKTLRLALEAHNLAPSLIPAADIAGRLLASNGNTAKAAKILAKTWKRAPHPDLALTYAYARPGDSPRDRQARVKALTMMAPHTIESPIALATAAIESHDWETARKTLKPLLDTRLTQRICTLMARIEADETGDTGRVREWLARAINAPRDPAWTTDGVVSEHWSPVSPVTGALDAFEWRVPVESVDSMDSAVLTQKLEEFVALGVRPDVAADPVSADLIDESQDIIDIDVAPREATGPAKMTIAAKATADASHKTETAADTSKTTHQAAASNQIEDAEIATSNTSSTATTKTPNPAASPDETSKPQPSDNATDDITAMPAPPNDIKDTAKHTDASNELSRAEPQTDAPETIKTVDAKPINPAKITVTAAAHVAHDKDAEKHDKTPKHKQNGVSNEHIVPSDMPAKDALEGKRKTQTQDNQDSTSATQQSNKKPLKDSGTKTASKSNSSKPDATDPPTPAKNTTAADPAVSTITAPEVPVSAAASAAKAAGYAAKRSGSTATANAGKAAEDRSSRDKTGKDGAGPKIFIPPRAPDDPGADASERDASPRTPLSAYRGRPIKGNA